MTAADQKSSRATTFLACYYFSCLHLPSICFALDSKWYLDIEIQARKTSCGYLRTIFCAARFVCGSLSCRVRPCFNMVMEDIASFVLFLQ